MSKRNLQYVLLVFGIIAMIGVYLKFIRTPAPPEGSPADMTGNPTASILPYGSQLNVTALRDGRMNLMTQPVYPTVTQSELGVPDPFIK